MTPEELQEAADRARRRFSTEPKPGDAVRYHLTFTGIVVAKTSSRKGHVYVKIRDTGGERIIPLEDVVEILTPTPDEDDVVATVRCPRCNRSPSAACSDLRKGYENETTKHPHHDRVEKYIEVTGWQP